MPTSGGGRAFCGSCGAPVAAPEGTFHPHRAGRNDLVRRRRERGPSGRDAWAAMGIGAAVAAAALVFWPLGTVFRTLLTVIHELGHTAAAWVLGSPALPQFDLVYGGGLSGVYGRQPVMVAAAGGALAYALWRARGDRPALIRWGVLSAAWAVAVFTPIREPLITAMGHGSELFFAAVFLHRALSGEQILRAGERPLYAALGLFLVAEDIRLALGLIASPEFREWYRTAKGDLVGDFIQTADNLGWSVQAVARLFLVPCLLTPFASFFYARRTRRG